MIKPVEPRGFEPLTPGLQSQCPIRSPNCQLAELGILEEIRMSDRGSPLITTPTGTQRARLVCFQLGVTRWWLS
jgi:hypothetical protein